jgi:undecaprenyl phosphate-alpha-L-ara4N flippase subunit ArnE
VTGAAPLTWAILLATPIAIAVGQLLFKKASAAIEGPGLAGLPALLVNPHLIAALALYGAATLAWVYAIRSVPLGQAYMAMALTFVLVPFGAWMFLGEQVTWRLAAGAALVIGGLVVAGG